MEKFEPFKPDEETIESCLDGFEARLLCHDIQNCEKKRHWCQALVGEAGRNIIKDLPIRTTWPRVKQELIEILGERDPKDKAFETLINYRRSDKGLVEIAADILTKAAKASDDRETQVKLGLKAFLKAIPQSLAKELRRKHFNSVRDALEEARFLQRVQMEESAASDQVLTVGEERSSQSSVVDDCIKRLEARGLIGGKRERPNRFGRGCWCCGEEGHFLMQCPTIIRNRASQRGAPEKQGNE